MVVNERQDDRDLHLPHVEFAYNNSVSAATGLAPNEVHMGRFPRLPLTVFDRTGVVGHQSLARDHLAYCDLTTDRQKRANDFVREHHVLTVSRVNRRNSALADELRPAPNFATGGWTIGVHLCLHYPPGCEGEHRRQGTQGQTRAYLDGPVQDPGSQSLLRRRDPGRFAAREQPPLFGSPLRPARFGRSSACGHRALQTLHQPPRQRGHAQIPTGGDDAVRAQQFSKKSPPYHVTQDDASSPLQRLEVEKITGHHSVRGRGGVIAVLYKTQWAGLSEPSWGREMDLHLSRSHILRYWAITPHQHRQTNDPYRRMRIGAAQRELSRTNGERFLAPGYACVPSADWLRRYHFTVLLQGAHFWHRRDDGFWWLGKLSASATEDKAYLVRFLDDPGPIILPLPPARYTTSTGAVRGSWCLQVHIASVFSRGIQCNVDESRDAAVAS